MFQGYNDASSNDNDSYSRYVNSAANKHDDSKLRDKFGALQVGAGRERNPASHDPYRFTRSTANPVSSANIDRAKLSHLTARYRSVDIIILMMYFCGLFLTAISPYWST